jgi:3',5'-nucleoside bisphosphate phosphatase
VPVTLERVLAIADIGAIGRPHVARALVEGGWVRDFREAFDRYLGAGRPAYVPKHRLTVADAIRLIHRAGGLAVLAHPGPEGTRARLESLKALGLDGVEVRHPGHNAEDTNRLQTLADHLGLLSSGGSDWHGQTEGPRVLGMMRVPALWLDRQDALVSERRATGMVA